MCAALIGGMDRLHKEYIEAARGAGVDLKVFTGQERSIRRQIGGVDLMILCTGKVSHAARAEAVKYARSNNIPLRMVHSSGLSSLKKCFEER